MCKKSNISRPTKIWIFHNSRHGPLTHVLLEWPYLIHVQICTINELHHTKKTMLQRHHSQPICFLLWNSITRHQILYTREKRKSTHVEGVPKMLILPMNKVRDGFNFLNLDKRKGQKNVTKLYTFSIFEDFTTTIS